MLDQDHPENFAELKLHSPFGQFPLLLDNNEAVFESTPIIEHLQACHPGPIRWIPEGAAGRKVRFLDRFFDLHVMTICSFRSATRFGPTMRAIPMASIAPGNASIRPMIGWKRTSANAGAAGDQFTLADCAAAPSLFYADWVEEIGPRGPGSKPIASGCLPIPRLASRRRRPQISLLFPARRSRRDLGEGLPTFSAADKLRSLRGTWLSCERSPPFLSGWIAADQARIALPDRAAIGILAKAEYRQCAPLFLAEPRRLHSSSRSAEAAGDRVERIGKIAPPRRRVCSVRCKAAARPLPSAERRLCAVISSGVMPSK